MAKRTTFGRGDRINHGGKRGHVEYFDALAGTFTITIDGGHVLAALGIDLDLAEPRKPKAPKPTR